MKIRIPTEVDRAAIDELFASVETVSGREAVSEHKRLRVLRPGVIERIGETAAGVAGYAQAAWHGGGTERHWAIELVTSADAAADAWSHLLADVVAELPAGEDRHLWIIRESELDLATRAGWTVDRTLHEMHRSLPVEEPTPRVAGIEVRPLRRGVDEGQWLAAHNAAFAGHSEVGGMSADELAMRTDQDWFDPDGLLLAWRGRMVVGSCWTKLHEGALGEIYLIGRRPEERGIGLGRLLALAGLADLGDRQGATEAMLFVDGANTAGMALYESLGFSTKSTVFRLGSPD